MPIGNKTKELAWIRPDQIQPGIVKRALVEYQRLSGAVISDTPIPKRIVYPSIFLLLYTTANCLLADKKRGKLQLDQETPTPRLYRRSQEGTPTPQSQCSPDEDSSTSSLHLPVTTCKSAATFLF